MSTIIINVVLAGFLGLALRFLFKVKGKWLAVVTLGILPPIFMAPLTIYYSLIEVGRAAEVDLDQPVPAVSIFIQTFESGLYIAAIWFCLGVVAAIAAVWLPKRK